MYKRIQQQIIEIKKNKSAQYSGWPFQGDMYHWRAYIIGPQNSPYEGGIFDIDINLPMGYPFKPPKVKFISKVYHPNINSNGAFSIDILSNNWSPALTIEKVLSTLFSLLSQPNPNDPLVPEIAKIFKENRAQFNIIAKQWVQKYARLK